MSYNLATVTAGPVRVRACACNSLAISFDRSPVSVATARLARPPLRRPNRPINAVAFDRLTDWQLTDSSLSATISTFSVQFSSDRKFITRLPYGPNSTLFDTTRHDLSCRVVSRRGETNMADEEACRALTEHFHAETDIRVFRKLLKTFLT